MGMKGMRGIWSFLWAISLFHSVVVDIRMDASFITSDTKGNGQHIFPQLHSISDTLPLSEILALFSIYEQGGGSLWTWRTPFAEFGRPWNFSDMAKCNPCQDNWQGVTCKVITQSMHIVDLKLVDLSLSGIISSNVSELSHLEHLTISTNRQLSGTISPKLAKLNELISLDLSGNTLIGSIPVELCHLTNIQFLFLSDNQLTGSIPTKIGELNRLTHLFLERNHLNGTIPSSIGNISSLSLLHLDRNHLSGSLPEDLCHLRNLTTLSLQVNRLTGTIPIQLSQLSELNIFDVGTNRIGGPVSRAVLNFTSLEFLYLNDNHFTGTLPKEVGNLTRLRILDLSDNEISGTIPNEIQYLVKLENLVLYLNSFTGSIPREIGSLRLLKGLELNSNALTGSIPTEISLLKQLFYCNLYSNILTGPIPPGLGQLSKLNTFASNFNLLTGTLPDDLCLLDNLFVLYLEVNHLTGTLPAGLSKMFRLRILDIGANSLRGTADSVALNLTHLEFFYLDGNYFTGKIPSALYNMTNLLVLDLSKNVFSGSLSSFVGNTSKLSYLLFDYNALSGTIPPEIGSLSNLFKLFLSFNHFHGTIPHSILKLEYLEEFAVSNNQLSGSILSPIRSKTLSVFDVSNNIITGSLPQFNGSKYLSTLYFAVNCIQSSLPEDYCSLNRLESMVLSGLNNAINCHQEDQYVHLQVSKHSSLFRERGLIGSIPPCIFALPNLTTLYIAGNGIEGTLPSHLMYETSIHVSELDLSHNSFSGTIPSWIWSSPNWTSLDLSFNRFSGHLPMSLDLQDLGNVSLYLNINRLSGAIPIGLKSLPTINMLNGNIFNCPTDRETLPTNDPYHKSYTCGSDTVDGGLLLWAAVATLAVVLNIGLLLKFFSTLRISRTLSSVFRFCSPCHQAQDGSGLIFAHDAVHISYILFFNALPILCVVGLPMYAFLTVHFGVYEYQYTWTVSACYLVGLTPAVAMFVLFVTLLIFFRFALTSSSSRNRSQSVETRGHSSSVDLSFRRTSHNSESSESTRSTVYFNDVKFLYIQRVCKLVLCFFAVTITLLVNGAYVLALTTNISIYAFVACSLAMSCFKLANNRLLIHGMNAGLQKMLQRVSDVPLSSLANPLRMPSYEFGTQVITTLNIFNNIVAPYFAELFVNPNCFLYLWSSPPEVASTYTTRSFCEQVRGIEVCPVSESGELLFHPGFSYNYLCSSSLLTSFVFVFILRYVFNGVLQYLVYSRLEHYFESVLTALGQGEGSAESKPTKTFDDPWTPTNRSQQLLWHLLPYRHRPMVWFALTCEQSREEVSSEDFGNGDDTYVVHNPAHLHAANTSPKTLSHSQAESKDTDKETVTDASTDISITAAPKQHQRPQKQETIALAHMVPSKREVSVRIVTDIALFFTYGVLFPPLAIVVALSVVIDAYMLQNFFWPRAEDLVQRYPALRSQLVTLKAEFHGIGRSMYPALRRVMYLVALFWSFSLFDTLGNDTSDAVVVGIIVFMFATPILVDSAFFLWSRDNTKSDETYSFLSTIIYLFQSVSKPVLVRLPLSMRSAVSNEKVTDGVELL